MKRLYVLLLLLLVFTAMMWSSPVARERDISYDEMAAITLSVCGGAAHHKASVVTLASAYRALPKHKQRLTIQLHLVEDTVRLLGMVNSTNLNGLECVTRRLHFYVAQVNR